MSDNNTAQSGTPIFTVEGPRATIRLNRPAQHNRIEPRDLAALLEIFDRVERDLDLRVLVITGSGKSFSSGYHIGDLIERNQGGRPPEGSSDSSFADMVDRLENLPCPTICALNGGVYGGSTDLALACDFRLGVAGMKMFMPAARLGIHYYEGGLRRYVTRLGLAAAKRLFLAADPQDSESLLRIGFLDEVVPAAELAARVDALANALAANAPLPVRGMKRSLNDIAAGRLDREALERARALCAGSEDLKEGLAAWSAKRAPSFKGR